MNADRVLTYLISNMRIEPSFPQVRNVSGFSEENAISYISFVCALIFDTGCCETISQSVQIPSRLTAPIILVFTSLQSNCNGPEWYPTVKKDNKEEPCSKWNLQWESRSRGPSYISVNNLQSRQRHRSGTHCFGVSTSPS